MLAASLYAPHIAKLLAYADCSVMQVLSNKDPRLCDCNRIIDADAIPFPDQPDKQKELSLKADWKYIAQTAYNLGNLPVVNTKSAFSFPSYYIPGKYLDDIFRPPRC